MLQGGMVRGLVGLFVALLSASFLVVPGRAAAAPAPPTPDPFFGTWSDGMSPPEGERRARLDDIAASGVGLVRQYVFWDRIERSDGVFDWSQFDPLVRDATARGITILPTLLYTPAFHSSKPPGSTSNSLFPPEDPETMARFAEAMVRRYGPNGSFWGCSSGPLGGGCPAPYAPIRAWEVWNEPDFPSWWKGQRPPDPAEYVPLLRATAAGIRRADPGAEVVLGALTNRAFGVDGYLDQLYDLGAAPHFDTLTVNPYALHVQEMVDIVEAARDAASRNGDGDVPIRVTEYGWATNSAADRPARWTTTESCQAAMLHAGTRRLVELREQLNIRSIIQFQWGDVPGSAVNTWPNWTGVRRADGSAKPSHDALTAAVNGQAAPPGTGLAESCPEDRRAVGDGSGAAADDSFGREVADGWGTADIGGAWAVTGGAASWSVAGGTGRIDLPSAGATRSAVLGGTSARNLDVSATFATDEAPSGTAGQLFTLFVRRTREGTEYRGRVRLLANGAVRLRLSRAVDGVETVLGEEVAVPGLTYTPGTPLTVRVAATGASPTTLRAKVWRADGTEPAAWLLSQTDGTEALQGAGGVGLQAGLPTAALLEPAVRFTVDDVYATSPK